MRAARPLFRGHEQPRVPGELGYYDLRDASAREAQAELAAAHGIDAFCYWHYWFEGRRLLERPFAEVLASGRPDLPFCLAWANESWSRRWLGEERDVLVRQAYSAEDDAEHARWLVSAFADPRYLKVGERPVFVVYRPHDLPEPSVTTNAIRTAAAEAGLADPYLIGTDAHRPGSDCRALGFDSTLAFAPQLGALPSFADDGPRVAKLARNLRRGVPSATLKVYDYADALKRMAAIDREATALGCVFPGWDNSPRRGRDAVVITGATPERFGNALAAATRTADAIPGDERLVFINAWNEWAEGNYLEPDRGHGRARLEAVRRVAGR